MTTIREAYLAFQDFSARQNNTIKTIKTELRESRAQTEDTAKELEKRVAALFPEYQSFPADAITDIAKDAGLPHNFSLTVSGLLRQNSETQQARLDMLGKHGSLKSLSDQRKALGQEVLAHTTARNNLGEQVESASHDLADVMSAMRERGANPETISTPETKAQIEYFSTGSLGRYFTPTWWLGHMAVKSYRDRFGDPVAALAARKDNIAGVAQMEGEIADKEAKIAAITKVTDRLDALDAQVIPDRKITGAVHELFIDALLDEKFVEGLKDKLGEDLVKPLVEPLVKILNLHKIETNLTAVLSAAEKVQSKIDDPLPKLKKGASRAGSKSIDIDLAQVETAVKGQEDFVKSYTGNTRAVRGAIYKSDASSTTSTSSSSSDTSSMFSMMNMWLLLSIASDGHAHQGFVNQTLGDGASLPNVALPGNDTAVSTGEIPAIPASTLSDIATQSFAVPDVAVPNLDVPNISIPDVQISIPSIDTSGPSFDYGGGGSSFDSGGGGSFGGGDGGGGF